MQIILAPIIFANYNHTIRNTVVISSYFGLQLIFMPINFAVLFGLRNSQNKGHANTKGFTVHISTKIRPMKALIWPVAMYGCKRVEL